MAGDEIFIGHQQLFAVEIANRSSPDSNFAYFAVFVTDGDNVANTDRSLKKDDQAADKISDYFLQAKSDANSQRCNQPL